MYTNKILFDALTAHLNEIKRQQQASKPRIAVAASKPDKMHLYVNGKHKLSADADKAHEVAETYMSQGNDVWLSRKTVTV